MPLLAQVAGKDGPEVRVAPRGEHGEAVPDRPQHVYTVRFTARELWGETAHARDTVHAELWEDYLERA